MAKHDFALPKHPDVDVPNLQVQFFSTFFLHFQSLFFVALHFQTSQIHRISSLQVINLAKSLTSRGFVRAKFSWNHHYYYLTDEGIDYLRAELHLPADIIPNTLKKSTRPAAPRFGGEGREGRPERGERSEKREGGEYRRSRVVPDAEGKDKATPAGDFQPKFVSPFAPLIG